MGPRSGRESPFLREGERGEFPRKCQQACPPALGEGKKESSFLKGKNPPLKKKGPEVPANPKGKKKKSAFPSPFPVQRQKTRGRKFAPGRRVNFF